MIQKLFGERTLVSMIISIVACFGLLMVVLTFGTDSLDHWLIPQQEVYPILERVIGAVVLIGIALLYRDVQGRMKLSQRRGYLQPLLFGLFVIPVSSELRFLQIISVASISLGLLMLLSTHRSERPEASMQRVGIAFGVGAILYPPIIWIALIATLMAIRIRQRTWRKGMIYVLGILFPFVILFTLLLALNWHEGKIGLFFDEIKPVASIPINWVSWIPALAILGFTFFRPMGDSYGAGLIPIREVELLHTQMIWIVGFILFGITGLIDWPVAIIAMAMPLSAMAAISVENASKWWIPDLVVVILLSGFLLK